MTLIATLREIRCDVIRIGGPLIILQVAGDSGIRSEFVVIVFVKIGAQARRHCVHAGKREPGIVVVEGSIGPRNRVVALLAGLRKVRRDVVGISRSLVLLKVTAHAGSASKVVIVVDMAVHALPRRHRMTIGQRESHRCVVEVGVQPAVGIVAKLASGRELRSHVIWIGGRLKI